MARPLALVLALAALAAAGCGGSDEEPADPGAVVEAPSGAEQAGCEQVPAPDPRPAGDRSRPGHELDAGKRYVAVVRTSCGVFEITLDARRAPQTGGSFVALARDDFFDGLTFHRVVPGFVVQGGDPSGEGSGGPGYSVVEPPPADLAYRKGVVAMAKTPVEDPGTSGSQFFVVIGQDAGLPPEYALLGTVTRGMKVVDRIGAVPVGPDERPLEPVVIRSVEIRES